MPRFMVRTNNVTECFEVDAADAKHAIDTLISKPGNVLLALQRPKAISAIRMIEHLQNSDGLHSANSWYDCERCDDLEHEDEILTVDLLAAGYEWTCPDDRCNTLNTEAAVTETVKCSACGRAYKTNPPDHAFD